MDKKEQKPRSGYTAVVPAVDQASRILLCLSRAATKMKLTDICTAVGIHKSKGYSILNTLQKFGFIHKDPATKTYSLGVGLISVSRKVLDSLNYNELAGPLLSDLAYRTQSTALYSIISDGNVFVVAKQEAASNVGITIRIGYRFSVSHGAHGKAIAAFLPKEEREKLLKQKKLFFHGSAARLDRTRLHRELLRCRDTGFAYDMGELNPGINVIAAPVFDAQQALVGCMFIMGTFAEAMIEEYGAMVAASARKFSSMLGAEVQG